MPLMSVMAALGRSRIDYFSLDVEGMELDVLKTIDWEKLNIKVPFGPIYRLDEKTSHFDRCLQWSSQDLRQMLRLKC